MAQRRPSTAAVGSGSVEMEDAQAGDTITHAMSLHRHRTHVVSNDDRPQDLLNFLANPKWVIDDTQDTAAADDDIAGDIGTMVLQTEPHVADDGDIAGFEETNTANGEETTNKVKPPSVETLRTNLTKKSLVDVHTFLDVDLQTLYDEPSAGNDSKSFMW